MSRTELPYAWSCLQCLDHGAGPRADLAARHHEKATQHGTMTHLDKPWWAERDEACAKAAREDLAEAQGRFGASS